MTEFENVQHCKSPVNYRCSNNVYPTLYKRHGRSDNVGRRCTVVAYLRRGRTINCIRINVFRGCIRIKDDIVHVQSYKITIIVPVHNTACEVCFTVNVVSVSDNL